MKQSTEKGNAYMDEIHVRIVYAKIEGVIQQIGHALQFDLHGHKPDFDDVTFLNALFIFQNALLDKMYNLQKTENINSQDSQEMAIAAGLALKNLIKTYTNIDTEILIKKEYGKQ